MGELSIVDRKVSQKNAHIFVVFLCVRVKLNILLLKAKFVTMKTRNLLFLSAILVFLVSCSRAVTPAQAASGNYHHCRPVR
jgi:hypothetical protein